MTPSREAMLKKYAQLLVQYSLSLKPSERLFIQSTTLAEPLVREVYQAALAVGALVEIDLAFEGKNQILLTQANDEQLAYVPVLPALAMTEFDAYLHIRAPFDLLETVKTDIIRSQKRNRALAPMNQQYSERTATRALKRTLCEYPTEAAARAANMTLEQYTEFIYSACQLHAPDPQAAWLQVRQTQQHIVDYLNKCTRFRYLGEGVDVQFSTVGRTWINSDGQTNMPSGEVYTSPVEDSVQGEIYFSYPSIYGGNEVRGVRLWFKDGYVTRWTAEKGQDFLDKTFQTEGARRLGEAAIGTNYHIKEMTNNILFDEKIGGTVHLALGQSYLQAGGKNTSSVHWDLITDMTHNGGEIYADNVLIYEAGKFLI